MKPHEDWVDGVRSLLTNRLFWIWIAIWALTRAVMVTQVGFWNEVEGVELADVKSFESWSDILATEHAIPGDEGWQYPPGAAAVMLLPRLGEALFGVPFGESFIALMLVVDLVGLMLMVLLANRTGREAGVWAWLLTIPIMLAYPILRFDLVPTVLAMAALVVIHRRPGWFGALAGIGAAIKVWPIVLLFGEWNRRRLLIATAAAAGAIVLVFVTAVISFGDQSNFFDNQSGRGLQVESVAATPWLAREMVTGEPMPIANRNGTQEVGSNSADAIGVGLKWLGLVVLATAAWWWLARDRAIRGGRPDLADEAISRDFVFSIVLLLVVVSRVLSPQFMIWLAGLSAVVLTAGTGRMARPAWIALGAACLTIGLSEEPALLAIRNVALLVAAIDAAVAMYVLVRGTPDTLAVDGRADHVPATELAAERP